MTRNSTLIRERRIGTVSRTMPDPTLETLGRHLSGTRRRLGLSREEVAEKTGIGLGSLTRWEQGVGGPKGPSVLDLAKLSRLYGVSLDWLLGLSESESALPTDYCLVDMGLVDMIERVKRFDQLPDDDVQPAGSVVFAMPVPKLRRLFHPDDPEWKALEERTEAKLEALRGPPKGRSRRKSKNHHRR